MELITQTLLCLAMNVYHEARSEDLNGQVAVAEVTLNRVNSSKYPDNVCDVVWQRKQFSWTLDGKSDVPKDEQAWRRAKLVAWYAMESDSRKVVGYGVTHYHADYVQPYWTTSFERVAKIGTHIFYRSET